MFAIRILDNSSSHLTKQDIRPPKDLVRHHSANIMWLNASTQNSTAALRLMKILKNMKTQLDVSILVLAHTPK